MGVSQRNLKHTAVYWAPTAPDKFGRQSFDEPIEIKCRWVPSMKAMLQKDGTTKMRNAQVKVDREVLVTGYLKLGTLEDVSGNPIEDPDAHEIWSINEAESLRDTSITRTVTL